MKRKDIIDLFVAEAMLECEKAGMASDAASTNRQMAKIFGAALAAVLVTPSRRSAKG